MDINNFYTGFSILLIYFTLIWQAKRSEGQKAYEEADELLKINIGIANIESWKDAKKKNWCYLTNPLNFTIDIISLSGILAFSMLIAKNWYSFSFSTGTVILFSISIMHLIISIDLWFLNIRLLLQIKKIKKEIQKLRSENYR
jgi:hypothetical protein